MIRRLVLFDVDGTLVWAGDLAAAVFDDALEAVLGQRPVARVTMSGKTDPQIVREYLCALGLDETEAMVPSVLHHLERHLAAAEAELAATATVCPGVPELLERLAGDDRVLSSLVTGNIAPNAVLKVAAFGLDRWLDLEVGAYGSDDADRDLLVPISMARAAERCGAGLDPTDVWVVGDTPRDLACAQAAGAHCLLVATGRYGRDELVDLGADEVLDDLSDTDAVLKLLTADLG